MYKRFLVFSYIYIYTVLLLLLYDALNILLRKCNLELYMTATEVTAMEVGGTKKASLCSLWQKVTKDRYDLVYNPSGAFNPLLIA